jgi:hypothetical protein
MCVLQQQSCCTWGFETHLELFSITSKDLPRSPVDFTWHGWQAKGGLAGDYPQRDSLGFLLMHGLLLSPKAGWTQKAQRLPVKLPHRTITSVRAAWNDSASKDTPCPSMLVSHTTPHTEEPSQLSVRTSKAWLFRGEPSNMAVYLLSTLI